MPFPFAPVIGAFVAITSLFAADKSGAWTHVQSAVSSSASSLRGTAEVEPPVPPHKCPESMKFARSVTSIMHMQNVTEVNIHNDAFLVAMHMVRKEVFDNCADVVNATSNRTAEHVREVIRAENAKIFKEALAQFKTGVIDPHFAAQSEMHKHAFEVLGTFRNEMALFRSESFHASLNKLGEKTETILLCNPHLFVALAAAIFVARKQHLAKREDCFRRAASACGAVVGVFGTLGWFLYDSWGYRYMLTCLAASAILAYFGVHPWFEDLSTKVSIATKEAKMEELKEKRKERELENHVKKLLEEEEQATAIDPTPLSDPIGTAATYFPPPPAKVGSLFLGPAQGRRF